MDRSTTEMKGKGGKARKLCPHGNRLHICIRCGGKGICEHNVQKYTCKECKCSYYNGKQKGFCKDCSGHKLCKTAHCTTRKHSKYDGHCLFCFVHLFPVMPVARNYMTKENTVATFLKEKLLMLPGSATRG